MKKLITTSFLALALCFTFQTAAIAQHETKIGVGLAYDGEVETAGIQLNATFRVSPRLGIAPSATFYFADEEEAPFFDSYLSFNLDGHYMIALDPQYHVYLLGGLNVLAVSLNDDLGGEDDSETELGLNLGLGGEYHLDNFSIFSDLKYVISDFDRIVLAVGLRFPI